MGTKGREVPRVVCCAIPLASSSGKVLVITSRKRQDLWCLKGGWELSDVTLERAASREALEEAGVRGNITRYVTTINSPSTTYHFYELEVTTLDKDWLESRERKREWVDYAEAMKRVAWKNELAQGLMLSTLAPRR
ncbi:NUDIX hydrolase domain-like protein [Suillus cothurnatus]|nr:NUDIX hydrolase domain-like protein [Suillus cothurnatus]